MCIDERFEYQARFAVTKTEECKVKQQFMQHCTRHENCSITFNQSLKRKSWWWCFVICKLVTDQWRASLGVRNSESCWFTEEIGTYMRCWESPGDLPLVRVKRGVKNHNSPHIKLINYNMYTYANSFIRYILCRIYSS
jgi:hypothetical protein